MAPAASLHVARLQHTVASSHSSPARKNIKKKKKKKGYAWLRESCLFLHPPLPLSFEMAAHAPNRVAFDLQ
jgi:hypothetical protein